MHTTWKGVRLVAQWEADVLVPYQDGKYLSWAFGRNEAGLTGQEEPLTVDRSFQMLLEDITTRERQLSAIVKVPVFDQMWDALMSLLYNWGSGNLRDSPLVAALNARRYGEAGELFLESKAHKEGLKRRREHEQRVYWNADYGDQSQFKLYRGNPFATEYEMTDFPAWIGS